MNADAVQGRYIVAAAIGVTIAVALTVMNLPFGRLGPVGVTLVLISLSLYDGQPWARWVLGSGLSILGGYWSLQALILFASTGLTASNAVSVLIPFAALVAGPTLLFSKQVREFVRYRKTGRNRFVHKALIVAWLLAVVAGVGAILWGTLT